MDVVMKVCHFFNSTFHDIERNFRHSLLLPALRRIETWRRRHNRFILWNFSRYKTALRDPNSRDRIDKSLSAVRATRHTLVQEHDDRERNPVNECWLRDLGSDRRAAVALELDFFWR